MLSGSGSSTTRKAERVCLRVAITPSTTLLQYRAKEWPISGARRKVTLGELFDHLVRLATHRNL